MELRAKHIKALCLLRQGEAGAMLTEALAAKDYEAAKYLQAYKDTGADFYIEQFFRKACGLTEKDFNIAWATLPYYLGYNEKKNKELKCLHL